MAAVLDAMLALLLSWMWRAASTLNEEAVEAVLVNVAFKYTSFVVDLTFTGPCVVTVLPEMLTRPLLSTVRPLL